MVMERKLKNQTNQGDELKKLQDKNRELEEEIF
jgi:hypothetical protein